jgi:AcrR family transcriptional regulator
MSQALAVASPASGILPAKQARSRATRDALIEAGRRLVEEKDFDALAVAEIAAAARCSVGAFYFRFVDKDGFFRALLEDMLTDGTAPLNALHRAPAEQFVAQVVTLTVQWYRRRRGLLRAAIRRSMSEPKIWQPLQQRGHAVADMLVQHLAKPGAEHAALERRIRFALQVLYGTLNNTILLAPGPLQLGDKDFEAELLQVFRRIIAA